MARVEFRLEIFKEGDIYIALCPELMVSSFGKTPQEASESLKEAVALFVEECQRMGTLEIVLEEAGFIPPKTPVDPWLSPEPVAVERSTI